MPTPAKIDLANLPAVALVGRVNVGKSTLFNKLTEQNKAIVSEVPGTTRTSNEGLVLWRGKYFRLIDTGGLTFTDEVPLEKDILKQTEYAMKEADIIVFVADGKSGILPQEKELAKRIRRIEIKPVIFVANKVDSKKLELNLTEPEWSRLGLGEPFDLSAANGRNVGDFLDIIHKELNKLKKRPKVKKDKKIKPINVAIIGKPNVGKSSLFNKLIGQEKVIVNEMAHTTREPHDILVDYSYEETGKTKKQQITFVDTAGIRRKAKVAGKLEREGIYKSINAVKEANIILFVIDGSEPISSQDKQLAGLLEKNIKSVILIVNKWDLAEDNSDTFRNEVSRMVYAHFPHLSFAPIIFTSGKTGYRIHDIFPLIIKAWEGRQTVVDSKSLDKFIKYITKKHLPSRGKGIRQPKIMGFTQLEYNPPIFEATIKYRTSLHRSYLSFIKNKLREQYNFYATPILIKLKKNRRA
ncbi:ribosome biogenesis GTPase Der [Patescibacteria group bacterium]|nr:ribosome biogenesis GTPase Der [Patescibacteria group bacterium]